MTRRPDPTFPPPHIDFRTEFEAAFERPYPGLCRDNAIEWLTALLQERDRLRGLMRELVECWEGSGIGGVPTSVVTELLERARAELGQEE